MKTLLRNSSLAIALACAGIVAGCAHGPMSHMGMMHGEGQHVKLTGANEVPPVDTSASGSGRVTIHEDHTVTAKIEAKGMMATAAHIHEGAPGVNGPVIVPLTKSGDDEFTSPPGAKLTDEQYEAYKAGNLYVNVHSAAHKGGEIRAQLEAK
jgi:CHRD domain-containing protein